MTKKLLPAKTINSQTLASLDPELQTKIRETTETEEFKSATSLRMQIYLLDNLSKEINKTSKLKLRQCDIACLLSVNEDCVKNQMRKIHANGPLQAKDGHPFCLTDEQLSFMKNYIQRFVIMPRKEEIRQFIAQKYQKTLDNRSFDLFLQKKTHVIFAMMRRLFIITKL